MTYEPKVGDRVRVVLEGEVTKTFFGEKWDRFFLSTDNVIETKKAVSIEKIQSPFPTTPGSVIRLDGESLRVRTDRGWIAPDESVGYGPFSDSEYRYYNIEVIFDAGAE